MARTIPNEQFDTEIQRLVSTTDRARDVALQRVERMRKVAGGAAVRELARRRGRDGAEAIDTAGAASRMLNQSRSIVRLREDLKIGRGGGSTKPDNRIAAGRILNAGRPLVGARLEFSTEQGQVLGEAILDESGNFVFERPREEFTRLVAGSRSLGIVVRDATGKAVFKTTAAIQPAGTIEINADVATSRPAPAGVAPVTKDTSVVARSAVLDGIKGLGEARIAKLAEAGVGDAAALATSDPAEIARLLRVTVKQATDIIAEAKEKAAS